MAGGGGGIAGRTMRHLCLDPAGTLQGAPSHSTKVVNTIRARPYLGVMGARRGLPGLGMGGKPGVHSADPLPRAAH